MKNGIKKLFFCLLASAAFFSAGALRAEVSFGVSPMGCAARPAVWGSSRAAATGKAVAEASSSKDSAAVSAQKPAVSAPIKSPVAKTAASAKAAPAKASSVQASAGASGSARISAK